MEKDSKRILFRCDASTKVGTGHGYRCLAAADYLKKFGVDSVFACRELTPHLAAEIGLRHKIYFLGQSATEQQEIAALQTIDPTVIVLDHYGISLDWQIAAAKMAKLVIFDDLANRQLHGNFLLNSNYGIDQTAYESVVNPGCQLILGPANSILKAEVRRLGAEPPPKEEKSVFTFFGGTDPTGETIKLLRHLDSRPATTCHFILAIGPDFPSKEKLLPAGGKNYSFHNDPVTFHRRLAGAEIFFGSGGTVSYERMFLGVPGVVISTADNQASIASRLAADGMQIYLGSQVEVRYDEAVNLIEAMPEAQRKELSHSGRRLVRQMPDATWTDVFL
jgi:UDP-2,4-diacetamido-2,4,6-trideoxy-beta-L-altropyranose hydrolase